VSGVQAAVLRHEEQRVQFSFELHLRDFLEVLRVHQHDDRLLLLCAAVIAVTLLVEDHVNHRAELESRDERVLFQVNEVRGVVLLMRGEQPVMDWIHRKEIEFPGGVGNGDDRPGNEQGTRIFPDYTVGIYCRE